MPQSRFSSSLSLSLAILVVAAGWSESRLAAAEARTKMAPFTVEAEFGVDGLRIQNSNSVLNPYLLEQHGVAQMQEIAGLAPNLFASTSDSRGYGDILALRGVANTLFFSPPGIALYVDDVPGGSVASYPSSLLLVDTMVVKAGPRGTEYGRNAAGGVIEINTRRPGAIHQGTLQVDRGSFRATSMQAAVDGPLNEQLGYSAAIGYATRDGYIRNSFLERSADDREALSGRAALHWKLANQVQLRFGVVAESIRDDAPRLTSLFSPDPFVVASNLNGETRMDRWQFSFQGRKTFPWGTVTATTSRQHFDLDPSTTDLDLSPMSLAFSQVRHDEVVWTQEVRVESLESADRPQWRAGVFYFDSETDGDALREFAVPPSNFVPPGFIQTERTLFTSGQRNLAGYGKLDQPLGPRTTLEVGARVERSESKLDRTKTSSNNFGFPVPPDPRLTRSQGAERVSATVGLVQAASEAVSLQARFSLAGKPAGYSAFTASPDLARFRSERMWTGEAGITFGPPKGRFGGSVLGFWSAIDHYQLERTVPNSTDFVVVNADAVTSRGLEAKFMWSPVDRLWWDIQAGYTDATFDDHRDAAGASVEGSQVPFIPTYTLRTGVTFEFGGGVSATASYAAIGRSYFDERNTARFSQPAYGFVNAQVRCRFDRWVATVYGHNLFDKHYYQFMNPEIFAGSPGAPRRFGVQLAYEY